MGLILASNQTRDLISINSPSRLDRDAFYKYTFNSRVKIYHLPSMRLFWELTRLSFQRQLSYRTANLAGLTTNFFFALLRSAVLIALYGVQTTVNGVSLQGAVTYTGLVQALIAFISLFSWYELMNSVYSGEVATDLLKPMNYFSYWMALDLGRAIASLLVRGITLMVGFALFFKISLPSTPEQWLLLFLALIFAWAVSFAWRFLVNLAAFWTPNALGIGRFLYGISWILTGFVMPLRFMPEWFQRAAYLTPFPSMINAVVEIYLGILTGPAAALALLTQLGWFFGLALLGQVILRAGLRMLVIQGG